MSKTLGKKVLFWKYTLCLQRILSTTYFIKHFLWHFLPASSFVAYISLDSPSLITSLNFIIPSQGIIASHSSHIPSLNRDVNPKARSKPGKVWWTRVKKLMLEVWRIGWFRYHKEFVKSYKCILEFGRNYHQLPLDGGNDFLSLWVNLKFFMWRITKPWPQIVIIGSSSDYQYLSELYLSSQFYNKYFLSSFLNPPPLTKKKTKIKQTDITTMLKWNCLNKWFKTYL